MRKIMIMLAQMLMIVLLFFSVDGDFSPDPMTTGMTELKDGTAASNVSLLVKPTSVSFNSVMRSRSAQHCSTSTPPLKNPNTIKHMSFEKIVLEPSSTRTTTTSQFLTSIKFQRSEFLVPFFSLNSSGTVSDSQISPTNVNNTDLSVVCPKGCFCKYCEETEDSMIEMTCRTRNLRKFLKFERSLKKRICFLNLAENNITSLWSNMFRGFENLRTLILDDNMLQVIRPQMFFGLPSLQYLSIQSNHLRKWKGAFHTGLPRFKILNLSGNKNFSFSTSLLKNTTLSSVLGISISKSCKNCNMSRKNATWDVILPESRCYYILKKYYPMAEELLSRFILFKGKCDVDKECELSLTSTKTFEKIAYRNKCWEVLNAVRPVVLLLGVLAIVFNTVVVIVIVTTKPLRSSTALLLISHMSFCDCLIGVYSIGVGGGHGVILESSSEFRQWRRNSCPYFRNIFVFGQIMEVASSLLVTTERYCAIVFCMNPSIRISKKNSAVFLLLFWILASVFCYLLHVHDGSVITDNYMCIIVRNVNNHENTELFYSQGLMLMLVVIYLITMVQYCHIYIYVRRSTINSGVRRETKLASRICIMVFTSFIFFALPNLIMVVTTIGSIQLPLNAVSNSLISSWLPPMFLVFNASLNPMLFAYRNDKFVKSFKNSVKKLMRVQLVRFRVGSQARRSRHQAMADENSRVNSNTMVLSVLASPRPSPRSPREDKTEANDFDAKQGTQNLAFVK